MNFAAFARRHGDDEGIAAALPPADGPTVVGDPSYFTHPEYSKWMMAHIAIMVIAWVFLLPIGIDFSLPKCPLPS